MRNRRHQKSVCLLQTVPRLEVEVISTLYPNEQALYIIKMTNLEQNELSLSAGRFAHYDDQLQDHPVATPIPYFGANYEAAFTTRLEWIGQHVTDSWSFDIDVPHLGADANCQILWSFKSVSDALLFKLTF